MHISYDIKIATELAMFYNVNVDLELWDSLTLNSRTQKLRPSTQRYSTQETNGDFFFVKQLTFYYKCRYNTIYKNILDKIAIVERYKRL